MRVRDIVEGLCTYLHAHYNHPELVKPHCVKIEKSAVLPTRDVADVLGVKHNYFEANKPKPHVFMVDAFVVTTGVISIGTVQRAAQCVAALRTWYQGLSYHAHAEGYKSAHQTHFHAICVGSRLSNAPLIRSWLAPWGQMSFWTYVPTPQGLLFKIDNYGDEAKLQHTDATLRRLLDHLPWDEGS